MRYEPRTLLGLCVVDRTRQACMDNVTMWHVGITIPTLGTQQYVPFLLLLIYIAVNNKQCAVLPWKCKNWFQWQRCRAAKYLIRLSKDLRLYAKWSIILFDFNGIWSLSIDPRIKVTNVKFRGNPFNGSRADALNRTKLIGAFGH